MGRKARTEILYNGCYAHVFSRSIEKRRIFRDREDFEYFTSLFLEEKKDKVFRIHHYCFMETHFHLAAGIESLGQFSKGLQQAKWKYTRRYNAKYKRWGPLWRERFGSMLIEDEKYLYACGRYIEHNPVKARLVKNEIDWEYSSARHHEGLVMDRLVDHYDNMGMPEGIDLENEKDFEHGWLIGSGWFKYKNIKGIV